MRPSHKTGLAIIVLTVLFAALAVSQAYAYDVHDVINEGGLDCWFCHGSESPQPKSFLQGVHGGYTATSNDCAACHCVHNAEGSIKLLFNDTITDTCQTCHDATGAGGVYGNIVAESLTVAAKHSLDATNVIPGGDATSGGSRTQTFTPDSGLMSCDDCHSPHNAKTVTPFVGDRKRGMDIPGTPTSKLLKQRPTGSVTTATVYGSDWCSGCHRGRLSGGAVHNHPVDSLAVTTTPFYYDNVSVVTSAGSLVTTMGTLGLNNYGYVMPSPRTSRQSGHLPICQQCHEDARNVGDPGAVVAYSVTAAYGTNAADNPRFQDFPHESTNPRFLIETYDNLCMNCHPVADLP